MFKLAEWLKKWTEAKKGKRGIENLVIILILGVIIIIVASSFFSDDDTTAKEDKLQPAVAITSKEPLDEILDLEQRLVQILSEIEGAGHVKVMITGVSDGEVVHAFNQVEQSSLQEEQSEAGIVNKTDEIRREQELVFMDGDSGERVPVVTKKYRPEIRGVVVVADGADSSVVRQNITNAVGVLMGLPAHRIQVLKRK
ncbi:MAG: stage III sporulation protein AG [Thermoclostridium sp.]|nr:stage III sporulation protein AG [Thermoclostridium sp.]